MKTFKKFITEKKAVSAKRREKLNQYAQIVVRNKTFARKFNRVFRYGKQKDAREWYTKVTGMPFTPEEGDYITLRLLDKIKAP